MKVNVFDISKKNIKPSPAEEIDREIEELSDILSEEIGISVEEFGQIVEKMMEEGRLKKKEKLLVVLGYISGMSEAYNMLIE